jgi:hypothetical protein
MAMLWQHNGDGMRNGNGTGVVITNVEIEEEEIARKYDKGALPLIAMPLLLQVHLLIQGQGFRQLEQEVEIMFVAGVQAEPEGR